MTPLPMLSNQIIEIKFTFSVFIHKGVSHSGNEILDQNPKNYTVKIIDAYAFID